MKRLFKLIFKSQLSHLIGFILLKLNFKTLFNAKRFYKYFKLGKAFNNDFKKGR